MKEVFSSDNSLEANVVSHLLEEQSIKTTITGEHLKSAMGEIPANSPIKVFVLDDADFPQALQIIQEFHKNNKAEKAEAYTPSARDRLQHKFGFLIGAICLILSALLGAGIYRGYQNFNITNDGMDYNGDGITDSFSFYKDDVPYKGESDTNFDGKIDVKYEYDIKGIVNKSYADLDFNGDFESTSYFKNGNIIREEVKPKIDGHPIHVYYFVNGILSEMVIKTPITEMTVRHDFFSPFSLQHSLLDSDKDGVFDKKYTYDLYENIVNTEAINEKAY